MWSLYFFKYCDVSIIISLSTLFLQNSLKNRDPLSVLCIFIKPAVLFLFFLPTEDILPPFPHLPVCINYRYVERSCYQRHSTAAVRIVCTVIRSANTSR